MLEVSGLGSGEGVCDLKSGGLHPPRGVLYNILTPCFIYELITGESREDR